MNQMSKEEYDLITFQKINPEPDRKKKEKSEPVFYAYEVKG